MRHIVTNLISFVTNLLGLNVVERIKKNAKHILMGTGAIILVVSFLFKGLTLELFGLLLLVIGLAWHYYSKTNK